MSLLVWALWPGEEDSPFKDNSGIDYIRYIRSSNWIERTENYRTWSAKKMDYELKRISAQIRYSLDYRKNIPKEWKDFDWSKVSQDKITYIVNLLVKEKERMDSIRRQKGTK